MLEQTTPAPYRWPTCVLVTEADLYVQPTVSHNSSQCLPSRMMHSLLEVAKCDISRYPTPKCFSSPLFLLPPAVLIRYSLLEGGLLTLWGNINYSILNSEQFKSLEPPQQSWFFLSCLCSFLFRPSIWVCIGWRLNFFLSLVFLFIIRLGYSCFHSGEFLILRMDICPLFMSSCYLKCFFFPHWPHCCGSCTTSAILGVLGHT